MDKRTTAYEVRPFPRTRAGIVATTSRARRKNNVHSLLEIDVTDARSFVKSSRKDAAVSFKAFLMYCVARAAHQFPEVHSMRKGRRHFFFHHVDMAVVYERVVEGALQVVPAVISRVDEKSPAEITAELEAFKTAPADSRNMVLGRRGASRLTRWFLYLPEFLQRITFNWLLGWPLRAQSMMGSIMFSNLSPFANRSAWGIPLSMHPLNILPGPVIKKPVVKNGEIVVRSILNLTITFDHDVVDGAQMARFIDVLANMIERPSQMQDAGDR